jgi:FkbM family methyltransferase
MKDLLLGNSSLQRFWWLLHRISLSGLNYGRGGRPSAYGEAFALRYAVERLGKRARGPLVIFDVGANRGQYLDMVLKNVSVPARIHCFEPQAAAMVALKKVAEQGSDIVCEPIGFSSSTEHRLIYKNSDASTYASLYPADYMQLDIRLDKSEQIRLETLDDYCSAKGIDRIDFLKIDVEGHELEVLKGATRMIAAGAIPYIQFEFGLASIESRTFLKDFVRLLTNYTIYRILPNGLARVDYNEYCELFLTTNYLAVHREQRNPD